MRNLNLIFTLALSLVFTINASAQDFIDDLIEFESTSNGVYANPVNPDDFITLLPGAWGQKPRSGNTGEMLHEYFNVVFPSGLQIGSGTNIVLFTDANAVTRYLPSKGTAGVLGETFIDPLSMDIRNSLVSELAALKLTTEFDRSISTFANSPHNFGDCKVIAGIFAGKSVDQIIQMADEAISGGNIGYPIRAVHRILAVINFSFVPGSFAEPILYR